ncbi:hypothetical protein ACU19_06815 [Actinobaculum suis]|nr:hypothetical protein ACU19_06815 [Actinobaculum suis]
MRGYVCGRVVARYVAAWRLRVRPGGGQVRGRVAVTCAAGWWLGARWLGARLCGGYANRKGQ